LQGGQRKKKNGHLSSLIKRGVSCVGTGKGGKKTGREVPRKAIPGLAKNPVILYGNGKGGLVKTTCNVGLGSFQPKKGYLPWQTSRVKNSTSVLGPRKDAPKQERFKVGRKLRRRVRWTWVLSRSWGDKNPGTRGAGGGR